MEKKVLNDIFIDPQVVMKLSEFFKIILGSLPSLKEPPVIFIISQLNPIYNQPFYLFKIHFNIILKITTWFFQIFPLFWVSTQNPGCSSFLSLVHNAPLLRELENK